MLRLLTSMVLINFLSIKLWKKKKKFVYIKRTNEDVKFICSDLSKSKVLKDVDRSPFKSINRDLGTNIRAFKIDKGFGAFWRTERGKKRTDRTRGAAHKGAGDRLRPSRRRTAQS